VRAGSLFSGVGGLDLAVAAHGFEVRWQVELDPWCTAVLEQHWPDVRRYGDVKELDPRDLEPVDLVCGGPPCQPFSQAGRRRVTRDDRWLWPEMARLVGGLRPRYVFVEAPAGLLSPWRDDGRWRPAPVEAVLGDLAALGFDAQWDCVMASDVGAPHERERVFVLAYAEDAEPREPQGTHDAAMVGTAAGAGSRADGGDPAPGVRELRRVAPSGAAHVADPAVVGRGEGRPGRATRLGNPVVAAGGDTLADAAGARQPSGLPGPGREARNQAWRPEPERRDREHARELPEPGVGGGPDGLPRRLDLAAHRWPAPPGPPFAWEPPRTVGGRTVPHRRARLKALGNAVAPQAAALAFGLLWERVEADR